MAQGWADATRIWPQVGIFEEISVFFFRNFRDTLPSDNHNMAGTSTIDGFLSYEPPLVRDVPLLCLIPGGYVTRCNWHMGITLQKKKQN